MSNLGPKLISVTDAVMIGAMYVSWFHQNRKLKKERQLLKIFARDHPFLWTVYEAKRLLPMAGLMILSFSRLFRVLKKEL